MIKRRLHFRSLLLISLLFLRCNSTEGIDQATLSAFDEEYKEAITSLSHSLLKALGTNRSYVLQRRKSFEDTQFLFNDSIGGSISYKNSSFRFTQQQKDLFWEGNLSSVYFDKDRQTFTTMVFRFEDGERRVCLIVSNNPKTKSELASKNPILLRDDRHYLVVEDY